MASTLRSGWTKWPPTAAAVLALAACATGAPPRSAQLAMPPAYEAVVPGLQAEALDRWWALYRDAQLSLFVDRALGQGYSVREALARLDESAALRRVALARFDPKGSLQANTKYRDSRDLDAGRAGAAGLPAAAIGLGATTTAGISLPVSWEVDFVGRRAATERVARADIEAARFDVESARAAIAAAVARTLFDSRSLKVQLEEAGQTLRIQRELYRVVGERARRGLAPASEGDRVAADLAQAEAQAENLAAALAASRRALQAVIGSATAPLGVDEMLADLGPVPSVPPTMPGELLARRPDVRMAAARVRRAAGNVRLAELEFFPRLTLSPGIGISATRGPIDATTGFWSLAAGIALPVLDRPRLHAQLDAEGARAEQSVLAYERTVQTAFSEADQALTLLEADRRRVATLVSGEVRARTAYDAALKRYELGFAGLQELLDGERAWRATRSALIAARTDALQRSVQVFQALGGGWDATSDAPGTKG